VDLTVVAAKSRKVTQATLSRPTPSKWEGDKILLFSDFPKWWLSFLLVHIHRTGEGFHCDSSVHFQPILLLIVLPQSVFLKRLKSKNLAAKAGLPLRGCAGHLPAGLRQLP
jgi:hypothetical protein